MGKIRWIQISFRNGFEVHTEGKYYDEAVAWAVGKMGVPKAAVVIKIEEIYTLKSGPTAGTKISE